MHVVDHLLQGVRKDILDGYYAHLRLHLKELMTIMSKNKTEDIGATQIRTYQCYVNCYNYYSGDKPDNTPYYGLYRLYQLRACKVKCNGYLQAVRKYLDDINFYAKRKMYKCSKKCVDNFKNKAPTASYQSMQLDVSYNNCQWKCFNRLDRRYKDYWIYQRKLVESQFYNQ